MHPFFDPTTCLPPDRMHQTDQGVFKTMLGWAVKMLEKLTFRRGGGKAQQLKVHIPYVSTRLYTFAIVYVRFI
jgi:hypothetical protein